MTPMTWQASIAYQFDWKPVGTGDRRQGDFISLGYSGSKDMAGVTGLVNGVPTRFGFVPQNRVFLTAGEWVMDGLKVAVEYSANWDYQVSVAVRESSRMVVSDWSSSIFDRLRLAL